MLIINFRQLLLFCKSMIKHKVASLPLYITNILISITMLCIRSVLQEVRRAIINCCNK